MSIKKAILLGFVVLVVASNPLMKAEACLIDPNATVDPTVNCSAGVTIGSGARIRANVFIGIGTSIGRDVVVDDDAEIHSGALIEEGSIVGTGAIVGSGVILRAGSRVDKFSIIGDRSIVGVDSRVKPSIMIFPDSTIPPATTISSTEQAAALTNHIAIIISTDGKPINIVPPNLGIQPSIPPGAGGIAIQGKDGIIYLATPPCPLGSVAGLCSQAFAFLTEAQEESVPPFGSVTIEVMSAFSTDTSIHAFCQVDFAGGPANIPASFSIISFGNIISGVGTSITGTAGVLHDPVETRIGCSISSTAP